MRGWVEKSFNIIPNKNLGLQDFSKIGKGSSETSIGKLPFEGRTNDLIVSNAYQEVNKIILVWAIKSDVKRFEKKSLSLIKTLIDHRG